jgi:SmpA/OmlA family protein
MFPRNLRSVINQTIALAATALVASIVFLSVITLVNCWNGQSEMTESRCNRIKPGMTKDQVTDILGEPNGSMNAFGEGIEANSLQSAKADDAECWFRPRSSIIVGFDKGGTVVYKSFCDLTKQTCRREKL